MGITPKQKKKRKIIILTIIGLVIIAITIFVIYGRNKEVEIPVQTEKVKRNTITQTVTASGKIQPELQVKITAEVSGEITQLTVKEGQPVKIGELLVRIKPDQYQAQVDRVTAQLQSTKSSLALQKATLNKAESEFKRAKELYEKNLSSEQEFVSANTSKQIAISQYESALSGVKQAQATLKDANENLFKTTIYSPMTGVISSLKMQKGERVSGSGFMQGTEIMTVADLSSMEARVDVGENDIVLIAIGDTTKIEIDAISDVNFMGTVYEIANTAKTKGLGTQEEVTNFEVKIRINNSNLSLRPGMSMTADIMTETRLNVITAPIQSVTSRKKKAKENAEEGNSSDSPKDKTKPKEIVFVVKDGKVSTAEVTRGISDDEKVEIISGLKEGTEIVIGSFKAINKELEDGSKVKVETGSKKFEMKKEK
ncbi:MAG: efflux RND transporter periplasmic adaptor subunit [Ignavibacteria bacterium]|nr:efflux RND transporter periplasmic adaptor subunit [Bacteroidota bacterium]MSQ46268.1 efflux RND transporter periplasmic adaptor subunit [Ignavibacteria bacterium]